MKQILMLTLLFVIPFANADTHPEHRNRIKAVSDSQAQERTVKDYTNALFLKEIPSILHSCKTQHPALSDEISSLEFNYLITAKSAIDELTKNDPDRFEYKIPVELDFIIPFPGNSYLTEKIRTLESCEKEITAFKNFSKEQIIKQAAQYSTHLANTCKEIMSAIEPPSN